MTGTVVRRIVIRVLRVRRRRLALRSGRREADSVFNSDSAEERICFYVKLIGESAVRTGASGADLLYRLHYERAASRKTKVLLILADKHLLLTNLKTGTVLSRYAVEDMLDFYVDPREMKTFGFVVRDLETDSCHFHCFRAAVQGTTYNGYSVGIAISKVQRSLGTLYPPQNCGTEAAAGVTPAQPHAIPTPDPTVGNIGQCKTPTFVASANHTCTTSRHEDQHGESEHIYENWIKPASVEASEDKEDDTAPPIPPHTSLADATTSISVHKRDDNNTDEHIYENTNRHADTISAAEENTDHPSVPASTDHPSVPACTDHPATTIPPTCENIPTTTACSVWSVCESDVDRERESSTSSSRKEITFSDNNDTDNEHDILGINSLCSMDYDDIEQIYENLAYSKNDPSEIIELKKNYVKEYNRRMQENTEYIRRHFQYPIDPDEENIEETVCHDISKKQALVPPTLSSCCPPQAPSRSKTSPTNAPSQLPTGIQASPLHPPPPPSSPILPSLCTSLQDRDVDMIIAKVELLEQHVSQLGDMEKSEGNRYTGTAHFPDTLPPPPPLPPTTLQCSDSERMAERVRPQEMAKTDDLECLESEIMKTSNETLTPLSPLPSCDTLPSDCAAQQSRGFVVVNREDWHRNSNNIPLP